MNPAEDRIIANLDRRKPKRPRPDRSARHGFVKAFRAYARAVGWPEARATAAVLAHQTFAPVKSQSRRDAEALFGGAAE